MKVKNFITAVTLSLFLTGCQVTAVDYLSHDGRLSQHEVTLVASGVLSSYMRPAYYHTYDSGYYYDYSNDIIVEDSYIGDVSLVVQDTFYGYNDRNPYRGNLEIVSDDMIIYLDVIDQDYVYVTLVDEYDPSYDVEFITTWVELGF
jgi:hypothetical protein